MVAARAPRGYDVGNHDDDVRYRVIADHSRTAAILIGDGVSPGNDGRGYVLRRLLRRVIRSAKLLGIEDPIVDDLMATVRDAMGPSYPELVTDFDRIRRIAVAEETAFNRTLASGSKLFDEVAGTTKALGPKWFPAPTPSPCTTPTAFRSSSLLRWPPRPACRSTKSASGN